MGRQPQPELPQRQALGGHHRAKYAPGRHDFHYRKGDGVHGGLQCAERRRPGQPHPGRISPPTAAHQPLVGKRHPGLYHRGGIAGHVPALAAGLLGSPGYPDFVCWHVHPGQCAGHHHQRAFAFWHDPRHRYPGRRWHRHRGKHLPVLRTGGAPPESGAGRHHPRAACGFRGHPYYRAGILLFPVH